MRQIKLGVVHHLRDLFIAPEFFQLPSTDPSARSFSIDPLREDISIPRACGIHKYAVPLVHAKSGGFRIVSHVPQAVLLTYRRVKVPVVPASLLPHCWGHRGAQARTAMPG